MWQKITIDWGWAAPQVMNLISGVIGALIGGVSVWTTQRREHRVTMRGAARALLIEMLVNCHAIKAFVTTVGQNPSMVIGPGIFPKVIRNTFDQHLPLVARLLRFDDLRRVAQPYTAEGYGSYVMLDAMISAKPQALGPTSLKIINDTSIMFLDAFRVLEKKVLTKKERAKFENEGIL
jgi:hypothetical protein